MFNIVMRELTRFINTIKHINLNDQIIDETEENFHLNEYEIKIIKKNI